MDLSALHCRQAYESDLPFILAIAAANQKNSLHQPGLTDLRDLPQLIQTPDALLLACSTGDEIIGFALARMERSERLVKIQDATVRPDVPYESVAKTLLEGITQTCFEQGMEVIYCAARTCGLKFQTLALRQGFRLTGVLAGVNPYDQLTANGLAILYAPDAVNTRRDVNITIHPATAMLAQLACQEVGIVTPAVADPSEEMEIDSIPPVELEFVSAQNLVREQYKTYKDRRLLSSAFYPFHEPDTVLANSTRRVEVFLKTFPEQRLATILGERITQPIQPVDLYATVCETLYRRGFSSIEIINDAADIMSTTFILQAGFLPCAYLPAMRPHGGLRRDYVVYARCFERIATWRPGLPPIYQKFIEHYLNLWR